jgi:NADPH2:quinone reductase
MKAVVCRALGSPRDLVFDDVPDPAPGPGAILLDVHAAGVNFPDVLLVQGKYQVRPPLPFSPGVEAAGVVAAVGAGAGGFRAGDRVIAPVMGAFAEKATAGAALTVPLPNDVDFVTGAAMMITYGTAYHALVDRAKVDAGETVFVTGGGGGVGTAAIEIAKALGARVVARASSAAKLELAAEAGADATIDATRADFTDALKAAARNGIDVAIDSVGGDQYDAALRAMGWGGRLLTVGFASGAIPQIPANRLLLKELDAMGVYWGVWAASHGDRNRANFETLFRWVREGNIRPRVQRVYPLRDAAQAIEDLMERRTVGKAVVAVR